MDHETRKRLREEISDRLRELVRPKREPEPPAFEESAPSRYEPPPEPPPVNRCGFCGEIDCELHTDLGDGLWGDA